MSKVVEHVNKIAILRANALGDLIVTLPAMQAIKAKYPQAELVLLATPWHTAFLNKKRTVIDRVIEVPVWKGIRDEEAKDDDVQSMEAFFREIKKEQFDIAMHFQGKGVAANTFLNRLGARLTVGLSCRRAEKIDRSIPFYYYQNEVSRYLEVAALIGAEPIEVTPRVTILKEDLAEADVYLEKNGIGHYILIHAFGRDMRRNWTEEKFARLADELLRLQYQVIFTGTEKDRPGIDSILSKMNGNAHNAGGAVSLGGLAALLGKSKLVIAVDSGPLHLAQAVGAKTVGIYWAPNLINWAPLTRRCHRPVISWHLYCPGCGIIPNHPYPFEPMLSACKHEHSFIGDITVSDVMEQASAFI